MRSHTAQPLYDPFPDFSTYFAPQVQQSLAAKRTDLANVRNQAAQLLDRGDFAEEFDRYVLGLVENPAAAVPGFGWLKLMAEQAWVEPGLMAPVIAYAVLAAANQHATQRGRQYRWPYHRVSNAYASLRRALAEIAWAYPYAAQDPALMQQTLARIAAQTAPQVGQFQTAYLRLTTAPAPYAACRHCTARCRYRFEAEQAAGRSERQAALRRILEIRDDQTMWNTLRDHCVESAARLVAGSAVQPPPAAVLCYALHAAQRQGLSVTLQAKTVDNIKRLL
jgi:hypothetical protein